MKKIFLLISSLLLVHQMANAQMTTRVVKDSLFIPWELVYGPDNHIWFTQKNGFICRLDPITSKTDTLYHETNTVIQSEGGMLGLALDPQFATQPYVYVAYNYDQGGYKERVVRYTFSGNILQNPQTLLDNINASNIHNGCRLLIMGDKLFITTGDAATSSVSQNVSALNGKTLRINLDGSIPADNPFPGSPVWSWGHRNAQGLVNINGKIFESEHGASTDDEINIIEKARNYGWPTVQGFCNTSAEITFCNDSNVAEPLIAWTPTLAVCGIDYYNHPMFPNLQQSILMTTLKDQKLRQLKLNTAQDSITSSTIINSINFQRLRDICVSPDGKIYISTSNSPSSGLGGKIDKIIEIYDPSYIPAGIKDPGKTVSIYPNPTDGKINIYINNQPGSSYQYILQSIEGKRMLTGELGIGNNTIDIKSYPAALYQIQIIHNKVVIQTEKILKQ